MATARLPEQPHVERDRDVSRVAFSPTSTMRFVCAGGEGIPDLYEERSARGDGPPLHRHPWPSWELVIDGTVRAVVDGEEYVLAAGDALYLPGGVPHTYVVESDTARVVGMTLSEGRFESLQRSAAPIMTGDGPPDMAAVGRLAADHDVDVLGPPLDAAVAPD